MSTLKNIIGLLFFLASSFCMALDAEEQIIRRATLSSGYVDTFFNSNEGLVHFPLSVIQGHSKLFDVVTDGFRDHWSKRLANSLFEIPFTYWLAPALTVSFHEFGHARVFEAFGHQYRYGTVLYGKNVTNLRSSWILNALRFITPPPFFPGAGVAYTYGSLSMAHLSPSVRNAYGNVPGMLIVLAGAGLNNQMLLAKKIATMTYENNGHMVYLSHYLTNKINGFVYAIHDEAKNPNNDPKVNQSSDPGIVLRRYKEKGYRVTHGHLKALSLLSLVSGSTFSYLRGYYDYLVHNDSVVRPAEIFGFRIPDVNGYINAKGLSFEIESDYRISPWLTVGLAYEFIWTGKFAHEFVPRARYNLASAFLSLNELWLTSDIVIGNGVGGSLGADYAPFPFDRNNFWSRFSYSADAHVYHATTLYGERNIISIARGNSIAAEVIAGVHLRY